MKAKSSNASALLHADFQGLVYKYVHVVPENATCASHLRDPFGFQANRHEVVARFPSPQPLCCASSVPLSRKGRGASSCDLRSSI
jgi:hypothetical protein